MNCFVLATSSEVQLAETRLDEIVSKLVAKDYPLRTMIHEVAQSDLFRRQ